MSTNKGRPCFSQFDEDRHRLPEGMRRIAYDADTQCYTFRDRSGQLYQSAPGEEYGMLKPVAAPLSHRRNVTITEVHDPALRSCWSAGPAKTFNDILPSGYIAPAQSPGASLATSPTRIRFVQAALPKVQGVVDVVRRRTSMGRPAAARGGLTRSESVMDEKRRLLEDEWEVVRKEEVLDYARGMSRSKSEMRPSRYRYGRK